ncbi:MAG: sigma-70 family RNA polymerase sigma factor [Anaerolineales bacterium]
MNEEKVWVLQARNGDDQAFALLVETYQTPVYNLCYRMLGEAEAAEDAAQETFLKVYQNLSRYDAGRPFVTWLLSIAAHHCIDKLRRRRFSTFSIDEDEETSFELPDRHALDPEAETARREQQRRLQHLLQELEPLDRAAIILRYWHDASEIEIAESLGLSVPAVKSRLHRARKALAALWQEQELAAETQAERILYESPAI